MPNPTTVVAKITLVLKSDGTMDIDGPTANPMLFYGMVELAKDEIRRHNADAARLIVPAPAVQGVPR